jgi:hypothetical protein
LPGAETANSQSCESNAPGASAPVQLPVVHCLFALEHLPLEQFESATQKHRVWPAFGAGDGVSEVAHAYDCDCDWELIWMAP